MKNKFLLFGSIFQIVVGAMAIIAFTVLAIGGEVVTKWIITLILAIAYVVMGILGVINYKSDK